MKYSYFKGWKRKRIWIDEPKCLGSNHNDSSTKYSAEPFFHRFHLSPKKNPSKPWKRTAAFETSLSKCFKLWGKYHSWKFTQRSFIRGRNCNRQKRRIQMNQKLVKFKYLEKATKSEKFPTFFWNYLVKSKQSRRLVVYTV